MFYVPLEISGERIEALVDSGASNCFISSTLVKGLNIPVKQEIGRAVKLPNGTEIQSELYIKEDIEVSGKIFADVKFYVLEM